MEYKLENVFKRVFEHLPENREKWNALDIVEWDSIMHVVLMDAIEEEFGITIPQKKYLDCTSFASIKEEIKKQYEAISD